MDNENFNVEFGEVVNIGGGTSDFNQLSNRPKYDNTTMTGATNIPKVPTKTSELNNDSDYQTGTEVESAISTAIAGKQDTLTAGNNITISNNTISATDTTYSAGNGLTLDGTQFSVNTETIATQQDVSNEATARENADTNLQGQIDAISASSDVTDIVGTYAELQAYDTTHLKDNDIIKVLQDESQNGETTYYRWSTSAQSFTLIGEEGPYYTKSQTDTLLQAKQDNLTAGANITIASDNTISATDTTYTAGTNVSISSGNVISATDTTYTAGTGLNLNGTEFSADTSVLATQTDLSSKQNTLTAGSNISISGDTISATDTTYSDFTGTDGTAAGTAGLVPAPGATDAGKFLKADGTWDTAGGGGSDFKVLSSADYNYPANNPTAVALWLLPPGVYIQPSPALNVYANNENITSSYSAGTFIVGNTKESKIKILAYGASGENPAMLYSTSVADGSKNYVRHLIDETRIVDTLTSTSTELVLPVKTGKTLNDKIEGRLITNAGAPTTATVGTVGQLLEDTTNGKLYICTDATNPYVWEEVGAGGGGPTVVQTTGTSTTDVMSQNATSQMIYPSGYETSKNRIAIGANATSESDGSITIGANARGGDRSSSDVVIGNAAYAYNGDHNVAIGAQAKITSNSSYAISIGAYTNSRNTAAAPHSIALGDYSKTTQKGQMDISTSATTNTYGYNNSQYRLLTGLYDGQSAHDAATVAQGNTLSTSAPDTSTVGVLGQLYTDTTNMHTYQCTAISGSTYTWTQRW